MRHGLITGTVLAGAILVSGCGTSGSAAGGTPPSTASAAVVDTVSAAANACDHRLASGDIYVRMISPGVPAQAQELGGEWRWNSSLNKCQTSVQLMISTAPRSAGNCTQVGYVADNPGYDPNATPAGPLKHVVARAGPAC
jgi:hypothetical protein